MMKVKELITRLLDEPMDAEVCLQDPSEHMSNGTMCKGYLFDITYIEPWNKHRICINFKDWRKGADDASCDTCKYRAEPSVECDRCDIATHSRYERSR
jgi:hypothetical protein